VTDRERREKHNTTGPIKNKNNGNESAGELNEQSEALTAVGGDRCADD